MDPVVVLDCGGDGQAASMIVDDGSPGGDVVGAMRIWATSFSVRWTE